MILLPMLRAQVREEAIGIKQQKGRRNFFGGLFLGEPMPNMPKFEG